MSSYKKEFEVLSVQDNTKYKLDDEIEKKYHAFAKDTEPDSKVTLQIHSDRHIDLKPGNILKVEYIKTQTTIGEKKEKKSE